jgi:hypothetical protein
MEKQKETKERTFRVSRMIDWTLGFTFCASILALAWHFIIKPLTIG